MPFPFNPMRHLIDLLTAAAFVALAWLMAVAILSL